MNATPRSSSAPVGPAASGVDGALGPGIGTLVAACTGPGGVPKVPGGRVAVDSGGLAGDGHAHARRHGGPDRAVCLFSVENYRALETRGVRGLGPGALGENLVTQGIDLQALGVGDGLVVGEVRLVLTAVRIPCRTLERVHAGLMDLLLPLGPRGRASRAARDLGSRAFDALAPGVTDGLAALGPRPRTPPNPPPGRGSLGPGWLARVARPGTVAPGDPVRVERRT